MAIDVAHEVQVDVTVVIVNFNGLPYLQKAVDSLRAQTFKNFELIVFDNASTDGSAQRLNLDGLPRSRVILNDENIGFAAGNNRAAEHASGKWLVLMNPDVEATPNWLEKLLEAASHHPEILTFTSAQLKSPASPLMDGAGDAYLIFGFPWRGGFDRKADELPESGWCFSACGAAAMYDLALFRQLNGFDERFFCYCEDVDLGFRLQLAGHNCLFVNDAVVYHVGSGITGNASSFSTYHGTRNRIWTYVKNMPPAMLLVTLPVHIVLTAYLLVRNAFTPRFGPMLRGVRDGIRGIADVRHASPWKQQSRDNAPFAQIAARMAWNPWRMSARKTHVIPLRQAGSNQ